VIKKTAHREIFIRCSLRTHPRPPRFRIWFRIQFPGGRAPLQSHPGRTVWPCLRSWRLSGYGLRVRLTTPGPLRLGSSPKMGPALFLHDVHDAAGSIRTAWFSPKWKRRWRSFVAPGSSRFSNEYSAPLVSRIENGRDRLRWTKSLMSDVCMDDRATGARTASTRNSVRRRHQPPCSTVATPSLCNSQICLSTLRSAR